MCVEWWEQMGLQPSWSWSAAGYHRKIDNCAPGSLLGAGSLWWPQKPKKHPNISHSSTPSFCMPFVKVLLALLPAMRPHRILNAPKSPPRHISLTVTSHPTHLVTGSFNFIIHEKRRWNGKAKCSAQLNLVNKSLCMTAGRGGGSVAQRLRGEV